MALQDKTIPKINGVININTEKKNSTRSGYPGVSWNRRMAAWLAFFYEGHTRRSRTFHPKYFEGNVEVFVRYQYRQQELQP